MCADSFFLEHLLSVLVSGRHATSTGIGDIELVLEQLNLHGLLHALAVVCVDHWLWNFADGEVALVLVEINELSDFRKLMDAVRKLFTLESKHLLVKQRVADGQLLAVAVEALAR